MLSIKWISVFVRVSRVLLNPVTFRLLITLAITCVININVISKLHVQLFTTCTLIYVITYASYFLSLACTWFPEIVLSGRSV